MPDATEILKRFQNMTHLECPICPKKVLDDFVFVYDGMLFYVYNSDGLKTRMPDATEILRGFQNMTIIIRTWNARYMPEKKFRMFFFLWRHSKCDPKRVFFGGILSAGEKIRQTGRHSKFRSVAIYGIYMHIYE